MTISTFLTLLLAFSVITSGVVEIIKDLAGDRIKSYNAVALVVGLFVGLFGLIVYDTIAVEITYSVVFYILMGLSTAGTAMLGYDKVKQMIEQFKK